MQASAASSQDLKEGITEELGSAEIVILKHPQSIDVSLNSSFSLNVTTKSDLPLHYQWYKDSLVIPGANSPTYSVGKSVEQDQGLYHVVVSNESASLSSYSATVNVSPENSYVKITREPLSKTITSGQPLQLQVEVVGEGPISYQWFKNGLAISGANADTFQIPVSRPSDSGHYQVQVSNRFSMLESDFASVTISEVNLPPAEISISVQPQSLRTTATHPFTLSVMASSPEELHYQWFKNDQAISGATEASYTKQSGSILDEGIYHVLIKNQQRSIKSHPARVQILPDIAPLTITTQPQSLALPAGQPLLLMVEATGEDPLVYQWYKDGLQISGAASNTLNIPDAHPSDSGEYQVQVSNESSTVKSSFASITIYTEESPADSDTYIPPPPAGLIIDEPQDRLIIAQAPESKTIAEGDPLELSVAVSGDGPFTYQWQKNGSLLPNATTSRFFVASARKSDQASYRVMISNSSRRIFSDFVNVWVTDKIAPVSIESHPESQLVPEGSVKQLSVVARGGGFITYQWRKNGKPIANAYSSTLTLTDLHEEDAGHYDVVVANSQGSKISNSAYLDVLYYEPSLLITQQPKAQLIRSGQALSLSVSAQSDSDLSYQWFMNGSPISGADSATYHIMQAGVPDAGTYSVLVSDAHTSQLSLPAEVSINEPDTFAIELSWDTPRAREDGSPLKSEEILEYIIEYGYDDHLLNQRITIPHSYGNRYIMDGVYPGHLLLRIATVDIDGHQGHFSDVISLSID